MQWGGGAGQGPALPSPVWVSTASETAFSLCLPGYNALLLHPELLLPPGAWSGSQLGSELNHYKHSAEVSLLGASLQHDCGTTGSWV